MSTFEPSVSGSALRDQRDGRGEAPVPGDVPTPAPVRLNHSSRVNWVAPSGERGPALPERDAVTRAVEVDGVVPGARCQRGGRPATGASRAADDRPVDVGGAGRVRDRGPGALVERPAPAEARHRREEPRCSSRPGSGSGSERRSRCAPRRSSPAKKPARAPVESEAVPIAGGWIESERGVCDVARHVPSSTPSRYRQNCDPLKVAAA